jgi:outer membrane lipoprotein SlyB
MKSIQKLILFVVIGLFIGFIHEQSIFAAHEKENKHYQRGRHASKQPQKKKCRSRRRRFGWGFLGGGATGGLIAGVAGGAKWTPLGIIGGGLLGGAIGAATAKDCEE